MNSEPANFFISPKRALKKDVFPLLDSPITATKLFLPIFNVILLRRKELLLSHVNVAFSRCIPYSEKKKTCRLYEP